MKKLTERIIGLNFMRSNVVVIETTHGVIHSPHLTMQGKTASSETNAKPQPLLTDDALLIRSRTAKTVTAFADHPSQWKTTGTVSPLGNSLKQQTCCFSIQCHKYLAKKELSE